MQKKSLKTIENIDNIRISAGSAALLGFTEIKVNVWPTTCYLMTYTDASCAGECQFCPQGSSTHYKATEQLSRVQWPVFSWEEFLQRLQKLQNNQQEKSKPPFQRICLQTLNYPGFYEEALSIISTIHASFPSLPLSAAIPPINKEQMANLKKNGLDRIGIALDACTPELFEVIKNPSHQGPYRWENHLKALDEALEVFGKHLVTTHLIVGLGESEQEIINLIEKCVRKQVQPGIFKFTPVAHTPMANHPSPTMEHFRRIQIARYLLLFHKKESAKRFRFSEPKGELIKISGLTESELRKIIDREIAFYTAGCPGCNRPNYTSRPGQEHSGFPRKITPQEKQLIFEELSSLIDTNPQEDS